MVDALEIVNEFPNLIEIVDSLQKEHRDELGFLPFSALRNKLEEKRIFLGLKQDCPIGYIILGSNRKPDVHISQICVDKQYRGNHFGLELVKFAENYTLCGSATGIIARCRCDLKANKFWPKIGFTCIAIELGGKTRNLELNIWRKQLVSELFPNLNVDPAVL